MTKLIAIAGLPLFVAGCATVLPPPAEDVDNPVVVGGEPGSCEASKAKALVGRQASSELADEARRLTGGRGIRWIQPGQAVTMDYRPDRINIELDGANRVRNISCG